MNTRIDGSNNTRLPVEPTSALSDPEGDFLLDIRAFVRSATEDFRTKFFDGFEGRRQEFNDLLQRAKTWNIALDLEEIAPVPSEHNPWPAHTSDAKRAKLREVANAAERLSGRVERWWRTTAQPYSPGAPDLLVTAYSLVERLLSRFHVVARLLRNRHNDRATLDISDEYDVQDLLHALLAIYFDDIRAEESTPSYAGATARTDFLLKQEQVLVEVKKTRQGLSTKELGEQLLIDIARYAEHPDCKMLVCFVYDPDGRVSNPRGLELDLEKRGTEQLRVRVLVRP